MSDPNKDVIRISHEEATSGHVDDLIKRQMSLRGESGVTRDRGRAWYYQSWFILLFVGGLAAFIAWGILEPYYNDTVYWQGTVTNIDRADSLLTALLGADKSDHDVDARFGSPAGSITIRGQKVYLSQSTRNYVKGHTKGYLDVDDIETGQTVGVYLEKSSLRRKEIAIARFLDRNPPPQKASEAAVELDQLERRSNVASLLLFPLVAGLVGLAIGAVDGLVCRLPRRALLSGFVGLLVGFIGGFLSQFVAGAVYAPITALAMKQHGAAGGPNAFGIFLQMMGRGLAWMMAGLAMGLGQGIALRSKRLLLYGFLGGVVGGLLGGLVFDPIHLVLVGDDSPSGHLSRMVGFTIIGMCVGAMIGIVERLARDAWLRMTQGPLSGKEFLIFKDVLRVGSSPRSDIYLFNDPGVAEHHATIRTAGDDCEIETVNKGQPVLLNGRPAPSARLRHGDQITVGKTVFTFHKKGG
ncbi:MAG: hypothetical protein QOF48_1723 [Verrucomicrobiota bacterium]|jgi:hypothetical protein